MRCRVVVATQPAGEKKSRIGHTRKGVVYELFFTHLPQDAFTASDVAALAPPIVAPLNQCLPMKTRSKTPTAGVLMRPLAKKRGRLSRNGSGTRLLELGHALEPTPMRTTEFAPPVKETTAEQAPVQGYGKQIARLALESGSVLGAGLRPPARRGAILSGWQDVAPNRAAPRSRWPSACALQRQDTRLSRLLFAQAVSVARASNHEAASVKSPAASSPGWSRAAAATRDWSRREQRRACMQLVRHQPIEVSLPPPAAASPRKAEVILSRPQRAHYRLSSEKVPHQSTQARD